MPRCLKRNIPRGVFLRTNCLLLREPWLEPGTYGLKVGHGSNVGNTFEPCQIEVIKRKAYGFHDPQYLALKVKQALPGRTPTTKRG